jgi:hypothetical protein
MEAIDTEQSGSLSTSREGELNVRQKLQLQLKFWLNILDCFDRPVLGKPRHSRWSYQESERADMRSGSREGELRMIRDRRDDRTFIQTEYLAGSHISNAINDAIELASKTKLQVRFKFNDMLFTVEQEKVGKQP